MYKKVVLSSLMLLAGLASAQEQVVNLYSARHYQTDEKLYSDFTKATGIKVNRVDADDAGILARLKAEGAASPADVILLVDAARLHKGDVDGLFKPIKSPGPGSRHPGQAARQGNGRRHDVVRFLDPRPRGRV
jgi:iron(III) transport system substrate-binding protein